MGVEAPFTGSLAARPPVFVALVSRRPDPVGGIVVPEAHQDVFRGLFEDILPALLRKGPDEGHTPVLAVSPLALG